MPPRIPAFHLTSTSLQSLIPHNSTVSNASNPSIPSFLLPFLFSSTNPSTQLSQSRHASILSSLSDLPGAYKKKIRRGRGPSSGKGKTAGRGTKGQKTRGGVPAGFQGGQTPDDIAHGKFGFVNVHSTEMSPINLSRIQEWIDQGRIDPSQPITLKELTRTRAIHGIKDGIKLLARGASLLTTPIHIVVSRASQSAIAVVEALGGSVTTRFYTPRAIRRIRSDQMHPYISLKWDQLALAAPPVLRNPEADTEEQRVKGSGYEYRLPDPTGRNDLEYYRNEKNRGYLRHLVKEGEGPSLYYKPPKTAEEIRVLKRAKGRSGLAAGKAKEDNKLW